MNKIYEFPLNLKEVKKYVRNPRRNLKTGFEAVDQCSNGIPESCFTAISGRPGMGKWSFSASIACNMANAGKEVLWFSLQHNLETAYQKLNRQLKMIQNMNAHADKKTIKEHLMLTDAYTNVHDIINVAKTTHELIGIDCIFIDCVEFITVGEKNLSRTEEERIICRELKSMAKETGISIVLLVSTSGQVEWRGGDKRPLLSDLRYSGILEDFADQVYFIYRPMYYDFIEDEEGRPTIGRADIIIAKNRFGKVGEAEIRYDEDLDFFYNKRLKNEWK